MFLFSIWNCFSSRDNTTIYSTRPFLPERCFFDNLICFLRFPPYLIDLWFQLALIYGHHFLYSLWGPLVAEHCMIVYRTHQLIDFVLVPLMIPAANLLNFANFIFSLFFTLSGFIVSNYSFFRFEFFILIQNFPLQSLFSTIWFFPFGIFLSVKLSKFSWRTQQSCICKNLRFSTIEKKVVFCFNNPFRTCLNHVSMKKGRRKRKARKKSYTLHSGDLSRWIKWND